MNIGPKNPKLLAVAQHAYDTRLSKEYTDHSIEWDWGYPNDKTGPIFRPNHGLAHSLRVVSYAPTVIEYFKAFAPDKENYQFSPEDVEKIQIALTFAVTGRENDGGYHDNPEKYLKFCEAHAKNFTDYCHANPGLFKDESEIQKYATMLKTYGDPKSVSPLGLIFKTCHQLDLLRVYDPNHIEKEFQLQMGILGRENAKELMVYADSCIRATGQRILCSNPMVGKPSVGYDGAIFTQVSTDVSKCFEVISSVPAPKPKVAAQLKQEPVQKEIESKRLFKSILINRENPDTKSPYTPKDYALISKTVRRNMDSFEILEHISELLESKDISSQDKVNVIKNASMLLTNILATQVPPGSFKPLIDYLTGTNDQKKALETNYLVVAYNQLLAAKNSDPSLNEPFLALETAMELTAQNIQANTQIHHKQLNSLSQQPPGLINTEKFIQSDLQRTNPNTKKETSDKAALFAQSLKAKSTELLLNVNHEELVSPYIDELPSTSPLIKFSEQLTESVINDILNAQSKTHRNNIQAFYYSAMLKCIENGDLNSASCILRALKSPYIQRLPEQMIELSSGSLAPVVLSIFNDHRAALKGKTGIIPIFADTIEYLKDETEKAITKKDSKGDVYPELKTIEKISSILDTISTLKAHALANPVAPATMDVSQITRVRILTDAQKQQRSQDAAPDKPIEMPVPANWDYPVEKISKLMKVLNSNLELPIHFQISNGGVILDKEVSLKETIG